ncbi:MAG TPA: hypothetical protein PLB26_19815, partial [Rubrivivax sp.]|nr:hypothetical protein [Rubrivivax sp.]
WRWNEYWVPLEVVIEFKRGVYERALTELARFLPRTQPHNRYLRSGMRPRRHDHESMAQPCGGTMRSDSAMPAADPAVDER